MKTKTILSVWAAVAAVGIVGCEQPAHPPPLSGTQTLRMRNAADRTRVTIGEQPQVASGTLYPTGEVRSGTGAGAGVVGPADPNAPGAAAGVGNNRVSGGTNTAGQGGDRNANGQGGQDNTGGGSPPGPGLDPEAS